VNNGRLVVDVVKHESHSLQMDSIEGSRTSIRSIWTYVHGPEKGDVRTIVAAV